MFPTKVLLATDGSAEAERMAKAVPERLDSELHVVRVAPMPDPGVRPEATFFDRNLLVQTREQAESEGRAVLDAQRDKLEEVGAEIAGSHLRHAHCPVFVARDVTRRDPVAEQGTRLVQSTGR